MYKLPEYVSADMGSPVAQVAHPDLTIATLDSLSDAQRQRLIPLD